MLAIGDAVVVKPRGTETPDTVSTELTGASHQIARSRSAASCTPTPSGQKLAGIKNPRSLTSAGIFMGAIYSLLAGSGASLPFHLSMTAIRRLARAG